MYRTADGVAVADHLAIASTCQYIGFCALKPADQAAWAAAIGSIAAAVVALGIAVSGGIARSFQRHKDGRALAAYLSSEVIFVYHALGSAITYIERFLSHQDNMLPNELGAFARETNARLMGPLMNSKVDRFGKFPSDVGEELAGAVGSLEMCRFAVSKFAGELRSTKPENWRSFSAPILEQLKQTKGNMERAVAYCRKVGGDM